MCKPLVHAQRAARRSACQIRINLAKLRRFGNLLSATEGADLLRAKIRRQLLPEWVLLQRTRLRLGFIHRLSAAKPSILDPGDHVDDIKVGLQISNLTGMFHLHLLD